MHCHQTFGSSAESPAEYSALCQITVSGISNPDIVAEPDRRDEGQELIKQEIFLKRLEIPKFPNIAGDIWYAREDNWFLLKMIYEMIIPHCVSYCLLNYEFIPLNAIL